VRQAGGIKEELGAIGSLAFYGVKAEQANRMRGVLRMLED
jgi:hypothetical protein